MSETVETFKAGGGITASVRYDVDGGYADPRQWDNLGTMVCWHPDYILGDEQFTSPEGRGAVKDRFEPDHVRSMEHLERYLRVARKAVVTIPLYLYDHSGISMSAGSPNVWDNPRVRTDHHGNGLGWDTTMVGYIYTTAERVAELCGERYTPSDFEGTHEQWIAEQLEGEVREYDAFLRGQVYYYVVKSRTGDVLESCGGFLGDDGLEEAKRDAKSSAEHYWKSIAPFLFAPELLGKP